MGITVRRLCPGDEEVACRVAQVFKEAIIETGHAAAILANSANHLAVAQVDGAIAGFLLAYRLDRIDGPSGQLFIYEIDVDPDHRRRGVGSALMLYARDVVAREGLMEAFLLTNRTNAPAMNLFERTGGVAEDDDGVVFVYPGAAAPPGPGTVGNNDDHRIPPRSY